jgi:DNA-binding CsgD family transcriptional regulator
MQWQNNPLAGLSEVSKYFPSEKLLSALNDSKVGVVICDRRMRYKALNETVAEIHDVPIEAHMGRRFHHIIGGLAEKVVPLWESVFSDGQPLTNLHVTGYLPKRSQMGHWIENLFPLLDDRGRVAQVGCFVIEVTQHRVSRASRPVSGPESVSRQGEIPRMGRGTQTPLSPREREVVRLVAEGQSNKEIASYLAISVRTVETYRARLMLKLNVNSIAQLVHYAIRNHIITI